MLFAGLEALENLYMKNFNKFNGFCAMIARFNLVL